MCFSQPETGAILTNSSLLNTDISFCAAIRFVITDGVGLRMVSWLVLHFTSCPCYWGSIKRIGSRTRLPHPFRFLPCFAVIQNRDFFCQPALRLTICYLPWRVDCTYDIIDFVDYAEEQSMEIEAMQAVFMDDFECTVYLCVSHG